MEAAHYALANKINRRLEALVSMYFAMRVTEITSENVKLNLVAKSAQWVTVIASRFDQMSLYLSIFCNCEASQPCHQMPCQGYSEYFVSVALQSQRLNYRVGVNYWPGLYELPAKHRIAIWERNKHVCGRIFVWEVPHIGTFNSWWELQMQLEAKAHDALKISSVGTKDTTDASRFSLEGDLPIWAGHEASSCLGCGFERWFRTRMTYTNLRKCLCNPNDISQGKAPRLFDIVVFHLCGCQIRFPQQLILKIAESSWSKAMSFTR